MEHLGCRRASGLENDHGSRQPGRTGRAGAASSALARTPPLARPRLRARAPSPRCTCHRRQSQRSQKCLPSGRRSWDLWMPSQPSAPPIARMSLRESTCSSDRSAAAASATQLGESGVVLKRGARWGCAPAAALAIERASIVFAPQRTWRRAPAFDFCRPPKKINTEFNKHNSLTHPYRVGVQSEPDCCSSFYIHTYISDRLG